MFLFCTCVRVGVLVHRNDIDNAVRVWEKNISPDKRPTMFSAILEKIIQAEDPVRLQKGEYCYSL